MIMGTIGGKNDVISKAKQKVEQDNLNAGNYLTTSNGSIVRDGSGNPIVTGTAESARYIRESVVGGNPTNKSNNPAGQLNDPSLANKQSFCDSSKVYPKAEYSGKPDTNKLAVSDKTHTYFKAKEKKRTTGIKQASSSETWDELKTAYGARYPYNHVVEKIGRAHV